jgi:Flp pilus assembly protein TadD
MHLKTATAIQIHSLMQEAAVRYGRDDFSAAAARCESVLALSPEFPDALHLLGLCLWKSGNGLDAALRLLGRAQELKPDDAHLWHNLGILREENGDVAGAHAAFLHAVELNPRNAESYYNLGVTNAALNDVEDAETAYRQAFALNDRHAGAAAGLAAISETQNRLDEAGHWLAIALREDPQDTVGNLTQAQMDFRAGCYERAAERLRTLLERPLSAVNRSLALGRLGMAYDRLGEYARAFDNFIQAKEVLHKFLGESLEDNLYGPAMAERMRRLFGALLMNGRVPSDELTGTDPVFLVGFPRSGTTLLDQILSSHSRIVVLEERETLRDVLNEYAISDSKLTDFAQADDSVLQEYRQRYWVRVSEFMPSRPHDKLFVDKLPLNTMMLPLIHRLFPSARIIFAVRDPRDVVLSCFMQSFEPNAAMRQFFSLDSSVRYYTAVMGVGRDALMAIPGYTHQLRYEDLVEDTEEATSRLLRFLGLSWEPTMLEYHKNASRRRINTPSYHQVAQPVYQSARQRWRNYADHLQPALSQLQPFVEFFGYA